MTDVYRCPRCNRSLSFCICRAPADVRSRALLAVYVELRAAGNALEELVGAGGFTDAEVKRLDKAITVMKVGFKDVKRVLRKRGAKGRLKDQVAA